MAEQLTLPQAAAILGVSRHTMIKAARRKTLAATLTPVLGSPHPVYYTTPDAVEHYRTHSLGKPGAKAKVR